MASLASPINSPRMLTSKFLLSTGILLVLTTLTGVWGNGCNNTDTQALPAINMCAEETWEMGRIYFNITTANMGSNTRCSCTLRPKFPGVKIRTTCVLWEIDRKAHRCEESFIQITGATVTNLTCTSATGQAYNSGAASDEVTFTLGRTDTSVEMSYCFYLYSDGFNAFDKELTCKTDAPPESSTIATPTSTSISYSSTPSIQTSISSSSPQETLTAVLSTTESSTTSNYATMLSRNSVNDNQEQKFPIGPVAGGVGGAVVLIIIVAVVVVVVFRKRRGGGRKPAGQRHPEAEDHGQGNPGFEEEEEDLDDPRYSTAGEAASGVERPQASAMVPSSSQTASAHGVPAASRSPYEFEDDAPLDHGAVNMDARTGSASVTLGARDSHPPTYAVVSKPRGREPQKPPLAKKPPKPAGLSTSSKSADVTGAAAAGGGGDVYAVVDKSRTRGGNARTNASSLPLAVAAPPPVPEASASASPGLVYADLEEVRGEGRQSAPPRPPANMATETEYAVIDHRATANFSSEA